MTKPSEDTALPPAPAYRHDNTMMRCVPDDVAKRVAAGRIPWPLWLTGDCPPWCEQWNDHQSRDAVPSDERSMYRARAHYRVVGSVARKTEQFDVQGDAPFVEVILAQGYRETGPRVILTVDAADGDLLTAPDDRALLYFTPTEANRLAELVQRAADWARDGQGGLQLTD